MLEKPTHQYNHKNSYFFLEDVFSEPIILLMDHLALDRLDPSSNIRSTMIKNFLTIQKERHLELLDVFRGIEQGIQKLDYTYANVDGQWKRIIDLPDGVSMEFSTRFFQDRQTHTPVLAKTVTHRFPITISRFPRRKEKLESRSITLAKWANNEWIRIYHEPTEFATLQQIAPSSSHIYTGLPSKYSI